LFNNSFRKQKCFWSYGGPLSAVAVPSRRLPDCRRGPSHRAHPWAPSALPLVHLVAPLPNPPGCCDRRLPWRPFGLDRCSLGCCGVVLSRLRCVPPDSRTPTSGLRYLLHPVVCPAPRVWPPRAFSVPAWILASGTERLMLCIAGSMVLVLRRPFLLGTNRSPSRVSQPLDPSSSCTGSAGDQPWRPPLHVWPPRRPRSVECRPRHV